MEPPEPILEMLTSALERRPIVSDRPVIGIYGKVAKVKGSFDLLGALERLASRGLPFTLLGAVGGQPPGLYPFVEALESTKHLRDRTVLVPFLAPWRVPQFVDRCDAVCFLERRFSISEHAPIIPMEVLKRRTALAVSAEAAHKLWFHDRLVDGENHILVPDPTDEASLAVRLERYLSDPESLARIGECGGALASAVSDTARSDGAAAAIDRVLATL
jgi:glycosyltransferase involved in cell wall biosynthesis